MRQQPPRRTHSQRSRAGTSSFTALKQRHLLFLLTRQLAEAQFLKADPVQTERLWQEAAALELDPDRLISLLYGVADHGDLHEMEAVDQGHVECSRNDRQGWWAPTLARFTRRESAASHRNAQQATPPARL